MDQNPYSRIELVDKREHQKVQKKPPTIMYDKIQSASVVITVEHGQKIKKFELLLKHFRKQTQAKRLVFMEKYASKHVLKLRKLKQYAAVIKNFFMYFYDFELKLLLQHFGEETQAKRLVFMEIEKTQVVCCSHPQNSYFLLNSLNIPLCY